MSLFYILFCRDAVNDLALHFLAKMKILVIKDIDREEIEFVCKVSYCTGSLCITYCWLRDLWRLGDKHLGHFRPLNSYQNSMVYDLFSLVIYVLYCLGHVMFQRIPFFLGLCTDRWRRPIAMHSIIFLPFFLFFSSTQQIFVLQTRDIFVTCWQKSTKF